MTTPEPVEITTPSGVVRGVAWPGDACWAVLLHDAGHDLDAWRDLPHELLADGTSVLALDLPGHGLSDGTWDPARVGELFRAIDEELARRGATHRFLVGEGGLASVGLFTPGKPFDAVVAFSPHLGYGPTTAGQHPTAPALVLVGSLQPGAIAAADRVFRLTRGWAVTSSLGAAEQGAALLDSPWGDHAREQTRSFLRDYRPGAPGAGRG